MRGTITSAVPIVVAVSAIFRYRAEWLDRIGLRGSYTDLGDPLQLQGPGIFEAGTYPTSRGALVVTAPAAVRPGSFRIDPVPGPLPLLGAGSALLWSRRLRRRRAV